MNWNIVDISQTGTATGGIDVMVTLGFCNGWCTGSAISCCGGLHDVYIRITQVSGDCAACPTGGVPTIIGPIDAGFVGPPYNAGNPQLPACPANLGDPGNVEIPFNFEGCPGEQYLVEVLAINRTTLNNCGGIGAIPNACTSGCSFSTFTDWLLAESVSSPGGVFTIPGAPLPPVLTLSTDDDLIKLGCGDPAGEFMIDYDVVACRDIPGTQLENTWTILSGPPCITIGSTPPNPTPCTASTDAPFAGTFGLAFPGYPDGCSAAMAPCGGPGTYPITVRMETTDLCTGEMTFQDITVTLDVAGSAAQCFDYVDLCEDDATTISNYRRNKCSGTSMWKSSGRLCDYIYTN